MTKLPQEPITVYLTSPKARIVEKALAADVRALCHWLVASGAVYSRAGFIVTRNGEQCRAILSYGGKFHWQRDYIERRVLPLFDRYLRLAALPPVHIPSRRARGGRLRRPAA